MNFDAAVVKDELKAVKWYNKAALQRFPTAKRRLGEMYADGTEINLGIGKER